ncbi:hypothetical protein BB560_000233 [Smittium megazygosporum]|uniref:Uncharacterized protein n=1 Tax=Smittium megazygosporum TaxID=133381 RepID=A0A2T9ZL08_9FUNG|nr:hypothetical protein BB560_000233 [Smittium megazygosporum]
MKLFIYFCILCALGIMYSINSLPAQASYREIKKIAFSGTAKRSLGSEIENRDLKGIGTEVDAVPGNEDFEATKLELESKVGNVIKEYRFKTIIELVILDNLNVTFESRNESEDYVFRKLKGIILPSIANDDFVLLSLNSLRKRYAQMHEGSEWSLVLEKAIDNVSACVEEFVSGKSLIYTIVKEDKAPDRVTISQIFRLICITYNEFIRTAKQYI